MFCILISGFSHYFILPFHSFLFYLLTVTLFLCSLILFNHLHHCLFGSCVQLRFSLSFIKFSLLNFSNSFKISSWPSKLQFLIIFILLWFFLVFSLFVKWIKLLRANTPFIAALSGQHCLALTLIHLYFSAHWNPSRSQQAITFVPHIYNNNNNKRKCFNWYTHSATAVKVFLPANMLAAGQFETF